MNMAGVRWLALVCGGFGLGGAAAQDEAAPDPEFLEYLGTWQESDEEWLAVSEWETEGTGGPDGRRQQYRKDGADDANEDQ